MISESVAVPLFPFSVSRSFIALMPRGVAALSSPSMLAARFMVMLPIAGCPAGTPGIITRKSGVMRRARTEVIPDFSITRESPSQKHIMPASPITMSIDTEAEWKSDFTASEMTVLSMRTADFTNTARMPAMMRTPQMMLSMLSPRPCLSL